MQTNADITIINHATENHADRYYHTVIPGVFFYGKTAVTVSENGMASADVFVIRIPQLAPPKLYASPAEWAGMTAMQRAEHWTIQPGDLLIRRKLDQAVVSPAKLREQYPGEVIRVTGWNDNRRGGLPHWRIDGA